MESYQSAKEEIKRAVHIEELIGRFVQLKNAGQNHIGLCPFHSEKDPSFTVSPSKQMFHCFGCKKGGDVFAFWMEYHKVTFVEALQDLAGQYHITLPQKQLSPAQKGERELKASLFFLNGLAAEYFHHVLLKSETGRPGREYFKKRSITKEIIAEFKLGYAPDSWDGLIKFLKHKNEDLEKAVQAGLIIPGKKGGYYDRFRGRVIFPIINLKEQVVGFGGRVLDDSLPKYLNTPETPIFHKGELLYGLHTAYQSIKRSGRAVIVEGYTDVLALKKNGFQEAVATLGTALTSNHIRMLKGYAKDAIVVFDPDTAGKSAAMKSLSIFLDEGLASKVMVLPEKDDPDSFVNRNGLKGFLDHLDQSMPMFDFYLESKFAEGGDQIEQQVGVLKEVLPVLSELRNGAQRSFYVRRLAERLGIAESAVLGELKHRFTPSRPSPGRENNLEERLAGSKVDYKNDRHLLNLLIHYPYTMDRLINLDFRVLLSDPRIMEIFDSMIIVYKKEGKVAPANIMESLEGDRAKELLREALLKPPIYPEEVVEQALDEFQDQTLKIKMTESNLQAKKERDLDISNKILGYKRSRDNRLL